MEGRPLDQLGLGMAFTGFSEPVVTRATGVDLARPFVVNGFLALQPDLQYEIPRGAGGVSKALCGLLQFSVSS